MEEKFSIWLILDLFVRVITMLAIIIILVKYLKGLILLVMIILFVLWAFRPIFLTLKNYYPIKQNSKKESS